MTNSVTFPVDLGGDGSTVTDDDNPLTGLANGGHRTRFVPAMGQIIAVANVLTGRIINNSASSTTSVLVGTGTKTFTTDKAYRWSLGQWLIAAVPTAANNYMTGQVTAYNTTTGVVTVNVTLVGGSGTYSSWSISTCPAPVTPNPLGVINAVTISANRTLVNNYQYEAASGSIIMNAATLTIPVGCLVIFDYYTSINTL